MIILFWPILRLERSLECQYLDFCMLYNVREIVFEISYKKKTDRPEPTPAKRIYPQTPASVIFILNHSVIQTIILINMIRPK